MTAVHVNRTLRVLEAGGLIRRSKRAVMVGDWRRLRAAADFEKGHIPGAKQLALAEVKPEHKLLVAAKSRPVVLVCKAGQSATGAAAVLRKAGFERVFVLDGGIDGWQQAGLPLAKGR